MWRIELTTTSTSTLRREFERRAEVSFIRSKISSRVCLEFSKTLIESTRFFRSFDDCVKTRRSLISSEQIFNDWQSSSITTRRLWSKSCATSSRWKFRCSWQMKRTTRRICMTSLDDVSEWINDWEMWETFSVASTASRTLLQAMRSQSSLKRRQHRESTRRNSTLQHSSNFWRSFIRESREFSTTTRRLKSWWRKKSVFTVSNSSMWVENALAREWSMRSRRRIESLR